MKALANTVPTQHSSMDELRAYLRRSGINPDTWKTGTNRSIESLHGYLTGCFMDFVEGQNPPTLIVHPAVCIVRHNHNGQLLELYEEKQVTKSGHEFSRTGFDGIAETMNRNETPLQGAMRGLKEELRFEDPKKYRLFDMGVVITPIMASEKWPPILVQFHRHRFLCHISEDLFKAEGYVEEEEDRFIYFKWKVIGRTKPVGI